MPQPTLTLQTVDPQQAGWDAVINSISTALHTHLMGQPLAAKVYTVGTLPAAASYQHCFAFVSDGTQGRVMYSDGTSWVYVRVQAAAVADLNQTISASPTQAEVQAISDKVDELLASLRTAGLLAT